MVGNVQSPVAQRPNPSFYTWTSRGSLMLMTFNVKLTSKIFWD